MTLALAVLPLQNAASVPPAAYRAWQWQRVIEPAKTSPAAEQCIVLDASLYPSASPGLRDVRLLQGGRQIPYAVQESYDEGALGSGSGKASRLDRSLYTTVLRIPLITLAATDAGKSTAQKSGIGLLPRHVPVERIELVPTAPVPVSEGAPLPVRVPVRLKLIAKPRRASAWMPAGKEEVGEVIQDVLAAAEPIEMTALGANLQDDASVAVNVDGDRPFSSVLLQMHQRSICFQPLSREPLLLLTGNPEARPVRYDYAVYYRPMATPLLATMGPMQRNPTYHPPAAAQFRLTRTERLILAIAAALTCFLLTVGLLRPRT